MFWSDTYCSMDKQYMEGVQNQKKANLMSVNDIVMLLYHSLSKVDIVTAVKRTEAKKSLRMYF